MVQPPVPPPVAKREIRRVEAEDLLPEPPPPPAPKKEQPGARACHECGSMIEAKYAFCWKCGSAMDGESKPSGRKPGTLLSSAMDLDDELTVQHEPRPLSSTMFSWTEGNTPQRPTTGRGSVLKLLSIGVIALILVSLGLFGLFRSETPTATATVAEPVAQPAAPTQPATFTTEVSRAAPAETTTTQQVAPVTPDDELKKLRERGMTASASERSKIVQAFRKVEKQYPRDYRFPYERAKFVIKASKSARSEAFKALNVAAEKAITTGKANEMLNGLESDKSGDFSSLSQGRFEWSRLVAALKRKDTSLLSE